MIVVIPDGIEIGTKLFTSYSVLWRGVRIYAKVTQSRMDLGQPAVQSKVLSYKYGVRSRDEGEFQRSRK